MPGSDSVALTATATATNASDSQPSVTGQPIICCLERALMTAKRIWIILAVAVVVAVGVWLIVTYGGGGSGSGGGTGGY